MRSVGDEPGRAVTLARCVRAPGHGRPVGAEGDRLGSGPRRAARHGGHSHHSGSAPGRSVGSPSNSSRHRPHCRGGTSRGSCWASTTPIKSTAGSLQRYFTLQRNDITSKRTPVLHYCFERERLDLSHHARAGDAVPRSPARRSAARCRIRPRHHRAHGVRDRGGSHRGRVCGEGAGRPAEPLPHPAPRPSARRDRPRAQRRPAPGSPRCQRAWTNSETSPGRPLTALP